MATVRIYSYLGSFVVCELKSGTVSAIVWYGDPRHVANKPFDRGTATKNGVSFSD